MVQAGDIVAPFVTISPGEVQAPGTDVTWKRDNIIEAPYVTVDPNGEVQAIGATVTWKRDMPAATPAPAARDENARRDYFGPCDHCKRRNLRSLRCCQF